MRRRLGFIIIICWIEEKKWKRMIRKRKITTRNSQGIMPKRSHHQAVNAKVKPMSHLVMRKQEHIAIGGHKPNSKKRIVSRQKNTGSQKLYSIYIVLHKYSNQKREMVTTTSILKIFQSSLWNIDSYAACLFHSFYSIFIQNVFNIYLMSL